MIHAVPARFYSQAIVLPELFSVRKIGVPLNAVAFKSSAGLAEHLDIYEGLMVQ